MYCNWLYVKNKLHFLQQFYSYHFGYCFDKPTHTLTQRASDVSPSRTLKTGKEIIITSILIYVRFYVYIHFWNKSIITSSAMFSLNCNTNNAFQALQPDSGQLPYSCM